MSEQKPINSNEQRTGAALFSNETDLNLKAGNERLSSLDEARALLLAREAFESTRIDAETLQRERSIQIIAETSVFLAAQRAEMTKANRSDYKLAA